MKNRIYTYTFLLIISLCVTEQCRAQQTNDEFKLKLKQSIESQELNLRPNLRHQDVEIDKRP